MIFEGYLKEFTVDSDYVDTSPPEGAMMIIGYSIGLEFGGVPRSAEIDASIGLMLGVHKKLRVTIEEVKQ